MSGEFLQFRQGIPARASYPISADSWPDDPNEYADPCTEWPIERCSPLRARLYYGAPEQQAAALLARLAEAGVSLRIDRGGLRWRCNGVIRLDLVRAMRRLEGELTGYVVRRDEP